MTDEEFAALFPVTPTPQIAALLGVSVPTVNRRARRLGVKKDDETRYAHVRGPKSEATRQKMSQAQKGRTFSEESRQKMSASRTGKVQTPDHRAHISQALKGKPKPPGFGQRAQGRALAPAVRTERHKRMLAKGTLPAGANHPGWKGGTSQDNRFADPRYAAWRRAVLLRDGLVCHVCGGRFIARELHAHHIKSYTGYEALRYDIDNGMTMCEPCHRAHHGLGERKHEMVPCACGCGTMIRSVNRWGQHVQYRRGHGRQGKTLAPESRAKIAASLTGRPRGPLSDEHRQKVSAGRKGKGRGPKPNKGLWTNTYMTKDEFIAGYATMTSRQLASLCHMSESNVCHWARQLDLPKRYKSRSANN